MSLTQDYIIEFSFRVQLGLVLLYFIFICLLYTFFSASTQKLFVRYNFLMREIMVPTLILIMSLIITGYSGIHCLYHAAKVRTYFVIFVIAQRSTTAASHKLPLPRIAVDA